MNWYQVNNEAQLNTPALLIYPDRVSKNIDRAIEIVGNVERLRPHVKTHKMSEVGQMLVQKGILKFKSATIAEAEMMAQAGATDILIAYQLVGPRISQLRTLKERYPKTQFSSLVDCQRGVEFLLKDIPNTMTMQVYIDTDVGHHRTGIVPGDKLDHLISLIQSTQQIQLLGFHAYDGHATDIDIEVRTETSDRGINQLLPYLDRYPFLQLVAGGSPSFAVHAQHKNRYSSPGTFVFWDHGYQTKYPQYGFEYAAVLATRVISKIDTHTFCFDLGHKHVASEGANPQITFLNGPPYHQLIHSEEHLTVRFDTEMSLEVGDLLYGVPRHICPTVALYPSVEVINKNEVTNQWVVTARNLSL